MHERILGIDYGRKRHGLAVSDGLGVSSQPLPCLHRAKTVAADWPHIAKVCEERDIHRVVLGLPLNMDGTEGEMAREVRRWGAELEQTLKLRVDYEDERLTSDEAEEFLIAAGLRPSERKKHRDSVAAALLVRAVLERERETGD